MTGRWRLVSTMGWYALIVTGLAGAAPGGWMAVTRGADPTSIALVAVGRSIVLVVAGWGALGSLVSVGASLTGHSGLHRVARRWPRAVRRVAVAGATMTLALPSATSASELPPPPEVVSVGPISPTEPPAPTPDSTSDSTPEPPPESTPESTPRTGFDPTTTTTTDPTTGATVVLPGGPGGPGGAGSHAPPETQRTSGTGTEWVVEPGDSFWSIAARLVETGEEPAIARYWLRLIDANRSRLVAPDNPDLIHPGLTLALPSVDASRAG